MKSNEYEYILNTWNRHVEECGGYLRPSIDTGYLRNIIILWVNRNLYWKQDWDIALKEFKANPAFNGSKEGTFKWVPSLEWLFKDRRKYGKELGIDTVVAGRVNRKLRKIDVKKTVGSKGTVSYTGVPAGELQEIKVYRPSMKRDRGYRYNM